MNYIHFFIINHFTEIFKFDFRLSYILSGCPYLSPQILSIENASKMINTE